MKENYSKNAHKGRPISVTELSSYVYCPRAWLVGAIRDPNDPDIQQFVEMLKTSEQGFGWTGLDAFISRQKNSGCWLFSVFPLTLIIIIGMVLLF